MLSLVREKSWHYAAQLSMAIIGIIVLFTFRHYGVTWDEEIQSQYGQAVFDYYISGFHDDRYREIFNLYLYGGMFDGLAAFINAYTPINIYETRHLLNAIMGLVGLWGAWRLGRLLGGGMVGLVAMILLALTPMYYGHMFNNPKDIPFAAGAVWSLYYMTKCLRSFPYVQWKSVLYLGVMLGLTLGIRVGGIMLLGYWGLSLLILAITQLHQRVNVPFRVKVYYLEEIIWALAKMTVSVAVIAYAVMLLCWPWAQEAPVENPIKALIQFSNFPQDVEVLLGGEIYRSTELPWFYAPQYFAVQLPLPQLFLTLSGLLLLPFILRKMPHQANRFSLLLIILTVIAPIAFVILDHSALYDAVRHFIFILPPISVLSALAFRHLITSLGSTNKAKYILASILCASLVPQAVAMIRLHPYEYIYVNPLEGGVKGAYGNYELDYWGSSFKEAAEKLKEFVDREGGVPPGKLYRVAICGPWSSAMIYLPPDYEAVVANETAEFFLSTTRWKCQNMRPGKEIIRVERMGAPLAIIKDLRRMPDYKPEPDTRLE